MSFPMRQECQKCGSSEGYIVTRSGQDCVHCQVCNKWQYNAPRTETGRKVRTIKTSHAGITAKVRTKVILRAGARCELCGATGDLEVGHITSVNSAYALNWLDVQINHQSNLCALCPACNSGIGAETIPMEVAQRIRAAWKGPSCG